MKRCVAFLGTTRLMQDKNKEYVPMTLLSSYLGVETQMLSLLEYLAPRSGRSVVACFFSSWG